MNTMLYECGGSENNEEVGSVFLSCGSVHGIQRLRIAGRVLYSEL